MTLSALKLRSFRRFSAGVPYLFRRGSLGEGVPGGFLGSFKAYGALVPWVRGGVRLPPQKRFLRAYGLRQGGFGGLAAVVLRVE